MEPEEVPKPAAGAARGEGDHAVAAGEGGVRGRGRGAAKRTWIVDLWTFGSSLASLAVTGTGWTG